MIFRTCSAEVSQRLIVCKGEGKASKITFKNGRRRKLEKVDVDGCLISSKEKRCDFLIIHATADKPFACFVELKGSDLMHAARQIASTDGVTSSELAAFFKRAYIVTSRVPRASPDMTRAQLLLGKRHIALNVQNGPAFVDL